MTDPTFADCPLSMRAVGAGAALAAAATAAVGWVLLGADGVLAPPAFVSAVTAAVLLLLRARHRLRLDGDRLVVGTIGGFSVPLGDVERWQLLDREEALELRAALRGAGRVALLPWLPAAAWLVCGDGRVHLVGTHRPAALRTALDRIVASPESADEVARVLAEAPDPPADTAAGPAGADARATGAAAAMLVATAAVFGVVVPLFVLDAVSGLPGGLAAVGALAGPALGALVVVEAAARTPLSPQAAAALAVCSAGLAPPAAAILAGATATGVVLLAAVTVPVAFAATTLPRGRARRA